MNRLLRMITAPVVENMTFMFFTSLLLFLPNLILDFRTHPSFTYPDLIYNFYILSEVLFTVYLLCLIIHILPLKIKWSVRFLIYSVLYALSLLEIFLILFFQTPITVQILKTIVETNQQESSEFFYVYCMTARFG